MNKSRPNKSKLIADCHELKGRIEVLNDALERDVSTKDMLMLIESARHDLGRLTAELVGDEIRRHVASRRGAVSAERPANKTSVIGMIRRFMK